VPVDDGVRRLEPNAGQDVAHRLVDLTQRVEQDLHDLGIQYVGLVKTRKTSALTYAEAFTRIAVVCAAMSACVACNVPFEEITTTVIGRQVDVDPKHLERTPFTMFGFDTIPTYWRAGMAKAFAATTVLLQKYDPK
jgi:hypothetical protein